MKLFLPIVAALFLSACATKNDEKPLLSGSFTVTRSNGYYMIAVEEQRVSEEVREFKKVNLLPISVESLDHGDVNFIDYKISLKNGTIHLYTLDGVTEFTNESIRGLNQVTTHEPTNTGTFDANPE